MKPIKLHEHFAFDLPATIELAAGVTKPDWVQQHSCRAQVIYSRGSEVIDGARLEGRPIYKLRIRQCEAARGITTNCRARDVRRNVEYSIREVDSITDRQWIFIVIEGGKAP